MSTEELDDRLSDFFASKCCNVKLFSGELPLTGKKGILYVSETGAAFVWNGSTYISVGGVQEDITYSELVSAIGSSSLVPGLRYRITDYATTHYIVSSAGVQDINDIITADVEPLVVTAISANEISSVAYSQLYPQDIIHYDWNPANWLIDASFADLTSYDYVDKTGNGSVIITGFKGVITFRHDTLQDNYTGYDFRGARFKRMLMDASAWLVGTTYSKFEFVKVGSLFYVSKANGNIGHLVTDNVYWQEIDLGTSFLYILPGDIGYLTSSDVQYLPTFHSTGTASYLNFANNHIEPTKDIAFLPYYNSTIVSNNVFVCTDDTIVGENNLSFSYGNTFINSHGNNILGAHNNVMGSIFDYNVFERGISDSIFSKNFVGNKIELIGGSVNFFGKNSADNTLGYFQANIIGSSFNGNKISYMYLCMVKDNFRYNHELINTASLSSLDLSTATHVYGNYSKNIIKNSSGAAKLTYIDGSGVLQVVNITA